MAFLRRRRFGRRRFRRGGYKGKFTSKHRNVSRFPRPELKYYDAMEFPGSATVSWTTIAGNTGTFIPLNMPIEGPSACNRIGRRINMKSIMLRIMFGWVGTPQATTVQEFYRIALVYDAQANGTAPAVSDVFASNLVAGSVANSPWSPVNLNNRDRFLVLKEFFYARPQNGATGTVAAAATEDAETKPLPGMLRWYVNLKGMETTFKSTTGTQGAIGDISTGALYLVYIGMAISSSGASVATTTMTLGLQIQSRLRFYD